MPKNPINQIVNVLNNVVNNKLLNKNTKKINLEDIKTNSGEIMVIADKKTAVYKDSQNNITKLDPKCTHMGCDVEWNDNKKGWHCPCHNSNFKATGEVINGPAEKPLDKSS